MTADGGNPARNSRARARVHRLIGMAYGGP